MRRRAHRPPPLADFGVSWGMLRLVALAIPIGAASALVALALLAGIGAITNALYYGRASTALTSPSHETLGLVAVLIPVGGALIVGLMARYGSEQIRGHGIPEAMENLLVHGSRVKPRLAVLKPISSVISIGTGGPFGAEGPIILTGGAFGSLLAQFFHFTASERKTLLVAGAAGGMSGVFGTPVAATLLAVELLLFEWKPRSMVPAAAAAAVAAAVRIRLADAGLIDAVPLFPVPAHAPLDERGLMSAVVVGLACGLLALLLTTAVYAAEDSFGRLPIHWVWWPAIGGLVVGIGGLIDRRALGVGYDSLSDELAGRIAVTGLLTLLLVKLVIWSVALGSGTSGGILAPLLLMGAAVGGAMSPLLPGGSIAIWCLIGMAGAMAGVMRSPFTAVIFAFELTHDANLLLPLLIAAAMAHLMSVLILRRSILTEKVARKGVHVTREYAVDPLEALRVRDVMTTDVVTLSREQSVGKARAALLGSPESRQRLYPVLDGDGDLAGVVGLSDIMRTDLDADDMAVGELVRKTPILARLDETLRRVADCMVESGVGTLPVVDDGEPARLKGLVSQVDLLRAHARTLEDERNRERVLRVRPAPVSQEADESASATPAPVAGDVSRRAGGPT